MPIYVFRCGCGVRFEHLAAMADTATPACPVLRRGDPQGARPGFSLGGQADAGLAKDADAADLARHLQRQPRVRRPDCAAPGTQRQKLEAKYPEIAGDQRPILAHEGRYHDAPLRAGDIPLGGTPPMPGAGHGHGHGHGPGGGPAADPKPAS